MQNESELSHCQMQSKRFFIQRRSLSLSATLSSNCDSILTAAAATETATATATETAGQCPSIGESVLARTYVCVFVYVCSLTWSYARNSDPVSVSVCVSVCLWSLSQRSGRSSSSSCAEILAALLTSLTFHFISISTPTNVVFSLSLAFSLRPLIYTKAVRSILALASPLNLSPFCLLY